MNTRIFDFKDYKAYLIACAKNPFYGKAFRTRLSEAVQVKPAFISQVLNDDAHLSAEQADHASRLLEHGPREREYLFLLVQFARAGTSGLRAFLGRQLRELKREQDLLLHRLDHQKEITPEARETYYSSWIYGALHLLVAVPGYSSPEALAKALRLSQARVDEALRFLIEMGLVSSDPGRGLRVGSSKIHLSANSPLLSKHHQNWKMRAIDSVESMTPDKLHFCGTVTLSRADAAKIQKLLREQIEACMKIVGASPEEELYAINVDFFSLLRE